MRCKTKMIPKPFKSDIPLTGFFRRRQTDQDLRQVTNFGPFFAIQLKKSNVFLFTFLYLSIGRFEELTPKVNDTKLITDSLWKSYEVFVKSILNLFDNSCCAVHGRPGALDGVHQRAAGSG